jgi:hypothetical protein
MQSKRLIILKEHGNNGSEDDLFVDLTIHDFSANLLKEFHEKVIKPRYQGRASEAIKDLIRRAIRQQEQGCRDKKAPVT